MCWQWRQRWSCVNYIFPVGRRRLMNMRLKRLEVFGRLFIIWEWWSQVMFWKFVVFHLFFSCRNFLASFSYDWDRIYRSMLWWIYRSLTNTSNGDEIAWVLIGSLTFSVAISSVFMLNFASIINSDSWVLSSSCPRTCCNVNCVWEWCEVWVEVLHILFLCGGHDDGSLLLGAKLVCSYILHCRI